MEEGSWPLLNVKQNFSPVQMSRPARKSFTLRHEKQEGSVRGPPEEVPVRKLILLECFGTDMVHVCR